MSELEQAIKNMQARHLERVTGPQRCCAKLGEPDLRNGMQVCGEPVEYREAIPGAIMQVSGWVHVDQGFTFSHHAVPESLIR